MNSLECLKDVTKEEIQVMNYQELLDLATEVGKEKHKAQIKSALIEALDIMEAESNLIV